MIYYYIRYLNLFAFNIYLLGKGFGINDSFFMIRQNCEKRKYRIVQNLSTEAANSWR